MRLVGLDPIEKRPKIRRDLLDQLLEARPRALVEAIQMINNHRDEIVAVMSRYGYTDHRRFAGFLDRDLTDDRAKETSSQRSEHLIPKCRAPERPFRPDRRNGPPARGRSVPPWCRSV